jgi:hypothetical protein
MQKRIKKESSGEDSATTLAERKTSVKVVVPLKDLVQAYMEAGEKIKGYEQQIDPLKEVRETLKQEIIKTFKERGEFSTRIEGATASLSVRKTAVVVDEATVIAQLKHRGLNQYVVESLSPDFDEAKKEMAKDPKKLIEGMTIRETEFLSVRSNDKEDARKIVTEPFQKIGGKHGQ